MISATMETDFKGFLFVTRAINEGMLEGIALTGKQIHDLAAQLAPEETGELKGSGRVAIQGDAVDISFGNDLPDGRALAQEYGTMYMPAQPYLTVAAKEIDAVQNVANAISRRLV